MKKYIIIAILFAALTLLSGCNSFASSNTSNPGDNLAPSTTERVLIKAEPVTIAQLLANPGKYAGKNIQVEGYLFSGWEWFGIAEGYRYEEQKPLRSTGGWVTVRGQPKNTNVDNEKINKLIGDIKNQLYVDSYAMPKSLFGKVQVTGEFQLQDGLPQSIQIAPIEMSILPWEPPASSAAPKAEGLLQFSDPPVLNQPTQIVYFFWMSETSTWDNADATARIKLPNGFELVDGSIQWQGKLTKGIKNELKATVRPIKKGIFEITAETALTSLSNTSLRNSTTSSKYALVLKDRGFLADSRAGLPGEVPNQAQAVPAPSDNIPILLELTFPDPPALGKAAEISLTGAATIDVSEARLAIQLPSALSLVSGDLVWAGDIARGQKVELKAQVKAVQEGKWNIYGQGQYSSAPKTTGVVPSYLMTLYIFKDGADILEIPPKLLPQTNIDLTYSNLPGSTNKVELISHAVAINADLPKAKVEINWYRSGFQLSSGNPIWEGTLKKGVPIEIKVILEPVAEIRGSPEIIAFISAWDEDKGLYSHIKDIRINIQVAGAVPAWSPTPVLPK